MPAQPVPQGMDWDMWLGPAAPPPYNADILRWRSFLDFSAGGTLGDWLVHCLGPAHLALQFDRAPPISVETVNVVEREHASGHRPRLPGHARRVQESGRDGGDRSTAAPNGQPGTRWADYRLPPQPLQRGINHQQDWIRACKGGEPGVSEFAVATKYIEWLVLGAVALRVAGKLLWDSRNMRFTNHEEANKYIRPYLRKGWELKL